MNKINYSLICILEFYYVCIPNLKGLTKASIVITVAHTFGWRLKQGVKCHVTCSSAFMLQASDHAT